ncbi:MiaB/RimO family radical SAM methylthiotransferase [bacterium]|nr:MiaB/RimO family radical SAM methylthiotransferase [bacterium]
MRRAYFTTLGCKLNQAETSQIAKLMAAEGIAIDGGKDVDSPEVIFVNTCAVTRKAAAKSRHTVSKLTRQHPDAIVIAAGCLAQADPQSLAKISGVDYVIGTDERFSFDWWISKPNAPIIKVDGDTSRLKPISANTGSGRSRPFLKIQDGCDQNCTYCIIPSLRGRNRSVELESVLTSARQLVSGGAHEIVLTGVRIGSWGLDIGYGSGLAGLLKDISELPGSFRIRLGSIEPWELSVELMEQLINNAKVCPHLHIPLQHTVPRIVEAMGRPPLADTLDRLKSIREQNPHVALGLDIITGFPGETNADFNDLVDVIEDLPVTYLHVFSFSKRPGTIAAQMPDQILDRITKDRVKTLLEVGSRKKRQFIETQAGRILTVIPDRPGKEQKWVRAVSENYIKVLVRSDEIDAGKPYRVRIALNEAHEPVGIRI